MVLLRHVLPWHLKDQTRKVLPRADPALSLCLLVSLSKVHHEGAPGLSMNRKGSNCSDSWELLCAVRDKPEKQNLVPSGRDGGGAGGGEGESLFNADVLVRIAACFPFCLSRQRSEPGQWC